MTKDSTKPYLAELSEGLCQRLQREQTLDVQEPVLFLKNRLNKGLYYKYKSKGYIIKVVTVTKKLPLDDFKNIKNNLGEIQNQQDSDRDKKQKVIPKKVLRPKEG